jgi:hypothetical protein
MSRHVVPEHFLWWKHHISGRFVWQRKIAWLPHRSDQSQEIIWLRWAWQGRRIHMATLERKAHTQTLWLSDKEFSWSKLQQSDITL